MNDEKFLIEYEKLLDKDYCNCNEMNCTDKVLTEKEIDDLVNEIMSIPVEKNNNCISTYGSINVDDLIDYAKEFRKSPTYDELLKQNQKLKEQLEDCQLQNSNSRENIMIKKLSFPNKEIKDKSLLELYNMPSYENLKKENKQLKGSLQTHEILLRANVEENQKLKEQLQQKENVMNKAKEYIKLKLNAKNKDGFPFLLFKRTHVEKILEVLDNKGEVTNAKD